MPVPGFDHDGETSRIAANLRAEAEGEAIWLTAATGIDAATARVLVIAALERAAINMRGKP
jgi:hypothetical protein